MGSRSGRCCHQHHAGAPVYPYRPSSSNHTMSADCTVHVSLQDRSYDILITSGTLNSVGEQITRWFRAKYPSHSGTLQALLVTDENVSSHAETVQDSLNQGGWSTDRVDLPAGEPTKSLESLSSLYDRMIQNNAGRHTLVVGVGGGVIGDLAGFLAATYTRGVPFVQVPTTLLADVDSSVGGKVGINHPAAKNMIGAFHQPLGVFIDTDVLKTLPDREYRAGLAEVVKYGVILDAQFFEYLEGSVEKINRRDPEALRHIITRSCELKAMVVEGDEYERTGLRAVLNYGHTFGHAFEALSGYGQLLHGEAVSIGMLCASRLAERLGRIDHSVTERQLALLKAFHLPTDLPPTEAITPEAVLDKMRLDKKTVGNHIRFVLPTRMGHVEVVKDVPLADALTALPPLAAR